MDALPIIAAPLIPHVGGARSHPGLPSVDAGDAERWQSWLHEQRLEVMQVWMGMMTRRPWISTRGSCEAMQSGRCQHGSHASRMANNPGFFLLFLIAGKGRVLIS